MQNFKFNQNVFVCHNEAIYEGIYRGVDTFGRRNTHTVKIPKAHREVQLQDKRVAPSYQEIKKRFPNSTNLLR